LGNKQGPVRIQHTVRYTELAPDRLKDFWRWTMLTPALVQRSHAARGW
jgi:hypothetical protein